MYIHEASLKQLWVDRPSQQPATQVAGQIVERATENPVPYLDVWRRD
jgi:hypothetical protein